MWKLTGTILLFIFIQAECWRFLHFGRSSGGNLGKPNGDNLKVSDYPEQWFLQKLDHFNPINEVTWKQVCFYMKKLISFNGYKYVEVLCE